MARAAAFAACLAIIASPAHAFMGSTLPSSMHLKSPASFTAGMNKLPVTSNMVRSSRAAQSAITMELVGKRYFLWKIAEKTFDQGLWCARMIAVMFASLVEKLFERTVTNVRLKALKNDLQGIRSTMSTLPAVSSPAEKKTRKKMADLENIKTVQELNKMQHPAGEERIHMAKKADPQDSGGSQLSKTTPIDAPTLNPESTFSFLMITVPLTGLLVNLVSQDKFVDSLSISAATACFLILMVDLAADTPSTVFTANLRKQIPRSVKKLFLAR